MALDAQLGLPDAHFSSHCAARPKQAAAQGIRRSKHRQLSDRKLSTSYPQFDQF
jgi:hypothetical protein